MNLIGAYFVDQIKFFTCTIYIFSSPSSELKVQLFSGFLKATFQGGSLSFPSSYVMLRKLAFGICNVRLLLNLEVTQRTVQSSLDDDKCIERRTTLASVRSLEKSTKKTYKKEEESVGG